MSIHSQPVSLLGKSILITGASGGIGQAAALAFSKAGATLLLHGNKGHDSLAQLLRDVREQGASAESIVADFCFAKERHYLVQEAFHRTEDLNVAVLTAGVDLMTTKLRNMTFSQKLEHLFQVDIAGTVEVARYFAENLRSNQRQGLIILFSWDGVQHGMSGETAQLYATAKGAIQGFSRSLAKTYAPNIRVLCVAPGFIKTTWGEKAEEDVVREFSKESLAGRWGTPEEVASLLRFLVSDEAAYLNAETITINGGRS